MQRLEAALALSFRDPALLQQALVHRSYLNESEIPATGSNERLEFLGDAVLGMVVAEALFRRFPELPEGQLTQMRAQLVSGATLAPVGARLELGALLVLGRGEEQSGGRHRQINVARALEALLGAIYVDRGLDRTREVILTLLAPEFATLGGGEVGLDPKSRLQQIAQGIYRVTPEYVTIAAEGPGHARRFTVEVRLGERAMGTGIGSRKRIAQQKAAVDALATLSRQPPD